MPNTLTDNVAMLEHIDLYLPPQPKRELSEFPSDISALQPLEISNLLIEYTGWFAYASGMEAYASAEASLLKGNLEKLASRLYSTSNLKTIEDRKNDRFTSKEYCDLSLEWQAAETRRTLLKSLTDSYDKMIWALSRCLTVLATETERSKY